MEFNTLTKAFYPCCFLIHALWRSCKVVKDSFSFLLFQDFFFLPESSKFAARCIRLQCLWFVSLCTMKDSTSEYWKHFISRTIRQPQSIKHLSSYLPLGVGFLHNREESINLTRWGRSEVGDLDVVQLQLWARIVVRWFSLAQADQMFDAVVQQVLVFTRHPGQRQSGQFSRFNPGEVVWRHGGHAGDKDYEIY